VTGGFITFRIFAVTLNRNIQLDYDMKMSGVMEWAYWLVRLRATEVLL